MNASEGMAGLSLWSLHTVHQAYLTHIVIVSNHRVQKKALKASGGNLTEHHTEDVSITWKQQKRLIMNLGALDHMLTP